MKQPLVLSLFPGIGLLDRAFEEEGFCIVRGPDVLWGGDIRRFHPPAGVFDGVIGGPPCQSFSDMAAFNRAVWGIEPTFGNLIPEYERCVALAQPEWFVMENVTKAPEPCVSGYQVRSLMMNNRWTGAEQNRKRRFSFGTRRGHALAPEVALFENPVYKAAVVGGHPDSVGKAVARYPIPEMCRLQGLPEDYLDHAPWTSDAKRRAIANGVPLPMGRAIAQAVKRAMGYEEQAA